MDSRDLLLAQPLGDPQLNLTLEVFLRMLRDILGGRLVSVVLFGSAVFDDLAPGYGDLDFLAVVDGDLDPELSRRLVEARQLLRNGTFGLMAWMLEGAFLPLAMLDPAVSGHALWWGTSGERPWERNGLGWLVHLVIRERGLVIYGRDVRPEVPAPARAQLVGEIVAACAGLRRQASIQGLHAVDALLTAARLLLWLREGRLSSKSEAADWAYDNAQGAWRVVLPQAKNLRLNPGMADSPAVRKWLEALAVPINEACDELEREAAGAVMQ